jgi:signal transduction histidine kinase
LAESVESIKSASQQLLEEVDSHRRLLAAEKGDLAVKLSRIRSLSVVGQVTRKMSKPAAWRDRPIVIEANSEEFELLTDHTLLRRVLFNMVKNALEASSPGEEVRIACETSQSGGVFRVHNKQRIPRAVALQIFQRSFSTKGEGRGIGTYSMKLFGEKYLKGRVWFTTSEEGTTFFISVPLRHPGA